MRRTVMIALIAAGGGYLAASMTAFGAMKANIWQQNGPEFRLGYVVGYLDAVVLAGRKDPRSRVPYANKKDIDVYLQGVNDYFANGANADRTVADAMMVVGNKLREKWMLDWARRRANPSPSPSSGP